MKGSMYPADHIICISHSVSIRKVISMYTNEKIKDLGFQYASQSVIQKTLANESIGHLVHELMITPETVSPCAYQGACKENIATERATLYSRSETKDIRT